MSFLLSRFLKNLNIRFILVSFLSLDFRHIQRNDAVFVEFHISQPSFRSKSFCRSVIQLEISNWFRSMTDRLISGKKLRANRMSFSDKFIPSTGRPSSKAFRVSFSRLMWRWGTVCAGPAWKVWGRRFSRMIAYHSSMTSAIDGSNLHRFNKRCKRDSACCAVIVSGSISSSIFSL